MSKKLLEILNNTANRLTLLRALIIPILGACYLLPIGYSNFLASGLLVIAGITDYLDGWIARKRALETEIGAFLDQAVDKILVATVLLLILYKHPTLYILFPAIIIILREFIVLSLRDVLQSSSAKQSLAVGMVGKLKTVIQFVSLALILAVDQFDDWIGISGLVLLYLAAAMTIISAAYYLKSSVEVMDEEPAED